MMFYKDSTQTYWSHLNCFCNFKEKVSCCNNYCLVGKGTVDVINVIKLSNFYPCVEGKNVSRAEIVAKRRYAGRDFMV